MSDLTDGLRQRLGLAEDADEDTVLAALDERLNKPAETAKPSAAALPEGTVAVDTAMLDQLRSDAAAGRAAREQQQADRRSALVQAAVRDGRIAPASREKWLVALEKDEDAESNLAALAPGLIPVTELGTASGDAEVDSLTVTDEELEGLARMAGVPKEALRG